MRVVLLDRFRSSVTFAGCKSLYGRFDTVLAAILRQSGRHLLRDRINQKNDRTRQSKGKHACGTPWVNSLTVSSNMASLPTLGSWSEADWHLDNVNWLSPPNRAAS